MQVGGGSSTVGLKKKPKVNPKSVVAALMDPETGAAKHALSKGISSPGGDVARQVYQFPGKLYNNADQDVRGLIDVGRRLFRGEDPGQIAEQAAHGFAHDITHPVEFANRAPLDFALTLAGAAEGGAGLVRSAARRGGFSGPGAFLGDETGAIGRVGRRLETGDLPTEFGPVRDMPFSVGSAASNPYLIEARWPDLSAEGVIKMDPLQRFKLNKFGDKIEVQNQALNEAAASEINAATGGKLNMPGVARVDVPIGPRDVTGMDWNTGDIAHPRPTRPGSLIEYIQDLTRVDDPGTFNYANPEVTDQMRRMNIFDRVIGNDDRAFGANLHAMGSDDSLMPVAVDQGIGFKSGGDFDTLWDPRAWGGSRSLNPDELQWVRDLMDEIHGRAQAGTESIGEIQRMRPAGIRGAIDRARAILETGQYPEPYFSRWR